MKTRTIKSPSSRFAWMDVERIKSEYDVDVVWMCRENGADALAVSKNGEVVICKGSVVALFDGVTASKFLLYRRCCEESGKIIGCICEEAVVTNSFEWAAVVVSAKKGATADFWFTATPRSILGNCVVDVAEDFLDNPYKDYALVDNRGPFD